MIPERIYIIGLGGIGSWLVPPLARYIAAKKFEGELWLCDGDTFSPSNGERQNVGEDTGMNKAEALQVRLQPELPGLSLRSFTEFVTPENVNDLIKDNSIVITCVDNHPCRALLAKRAAELDDIALLSAGNELWDGNVHVFLRQRGESLTEDLLTRHPEISKVKDGDRATMSCEELAQEGEPQLLITNFMAAASALQSFIMLYERETFKRRGCPLPQEVYFDVRKGALSMVAAA